MFCTKCGAALAPDGSCPNCSPATQTIPQSQVQQQSPLAQPQFNTQQGYAPAPAPKTGINFQKLLENKFNLMTAIAIAGTVSLMALPILSFFGMVDIPLFFLFSKVFSMIPNVGGLGMVGIILLLGLFSGAFSIYGACKKNNQFVLYGSAGAAGMLLIFFIILNSAVGSLNNAGMLGELAEEVGAASASFSAFSLLGIGFWLAAIAFIANIVVSIKNNNR